MGRPRRPACQVCGVALVKPGRGRPPSRCARHGGRGQKVIVETVTERMRWQDAEFLTKLADTLRAELHRRRGEVVWPREMAEKVVRELDGVVSRNRG